VAVHWTEPATKVVDNFGDEWGSDEQGGDSFEKAGGS